MQALGIITLALEAANCKDSGQGFRGAGEHPSARARVGTGSRMSTYYIAAIESLKDQLMYAPRDVRERNIARLERLIDQIQADGRYTYAHVFTELTGLPPGTRVSAVMNGAQLRRDLLTMLLDLSEST